jgi:hypothetical protein
MWAFLFTLGIFLFLALLGFAIISVFNPRLRVLQGILVSPAMGIAATILPVFFINRYGIPVKDFGLILVISLAFMAILVLAIKRPLFSLKRLWPVMGILVGALLLSGWPMFSYGFDWVSFANDDMANYCLAAQRFLNHGFFEKPNLSDLQLGKDYSQVYWFMHVAGGARSGSELMLASTWAVSGLNAHQIFMPVILALHLALIAGTGALVAGFGHSRRMPLIAMVLLAVSPLTTLGVLSQLIGQVGGLALLVAAVTLMYRPLVNTQWKNVCKASLLAGLILAALFVWYPEVLPFLGLGGVVYLGLQIQYRGWKIAPRIFLPAFLVGGLILVVLNQYAITALLFMLAQGTGLHARDWVNILFPFYLVPSGLPTFLGVIPIGKNILEPFLSLSIGLGMVFFYYLGRYVLPSQIRQARVAASIFLIMVGMGLLLFFQNDSFGLYKLAMFSQPFLMAVMAIQLDKIKWPLYLKKVLILVLLLMVFNQSVYVKFSEGENYGGFVEIPHASRLKINQQFHDLIQEIKSQNSMSTLVLGSSHIVLAKFQALYTNGMQTIFPSRDFFENIFPQSLYLEDKKIAQMASNFSIKKKSENEFKINSNHSSRKKNFCISGFGYDIFDFYWGKADENEGSNFSYGPIFGDNRLQFIHSKNGQHYYLGKKEKISFFQLEKDPLFPGRVFSALGQNLLFKVFNPSEMPRAVVELTSTVLKQFDSELPRPKIENTRLNFVGRGSGRIFSDPIEPMKLEDSFYISVDIGRDGRPFPNTRSGLMALYGQNIPLDPRWPTTFGRDISLMSEQQYQAIQAPTHVQNFPVDLANKNLAYSGIYEDGWVSENAFFELSAQASSTKLVVKGMVPQIKDVAFSTQLTIFVDGQKIRTQKLGLGDFNIQVPIADLKPRQRVEISFSNTQRLPGDDGRITAGKINFIGYL